MKLFLSAICASFLLAPLTFASDCEKGKCDKEKKEEGTIAGKCKKCDEGEGAKKEEGALAGKCKDKKCDEEKKEEGTLAHCGKCKGDKEHKEGGDKKEGTLAGKCGDKKCDEEKKEEGTLA